MRKIGMILVSALLGMGLFSLEAAGVPPSGALAVERLRCEYLEEPLCVDVPQPRLSWEPVAMDSAARGKRQSAYRVLVASSLEKLAADSGDLWDSGKVLSDEIFLIEYQGEPLASRVVCFWKVKVWDEGGVEGIWSEPSTWGMGLRNPEDWTARWISRDWGEGRHPRRLGYLSRAYPEAAPDPIPCESRVPGRSLMGSSPSA